MMVVFTRHVEVWKCVVDIAVGIMAGSGSLPLESLFGVDLERGSEDGDKLGTNLSKSTHFCSHTSALSSV